jgi:methylenetetrahydrofolate reductase (NADPH)
MTYDKTELQKRVESGKPLLIVEISPPPSGDPAPLLAEAKHFHGKVHTLGISDNRDGVSMSALAAAQLVSSAGFETILHLTTRECLGARALGIRNILCTSGTHQTLGLSSGARNVYDLDAIQLLQALSDPIASQKIVGEKGLNGLSALYKGAVASPFADPVALQIKRLGKKVRAGARFFITQPVFDLERFGVWWKEVTKAGLHEKAAIIAGIRVLTDAESARAYASSRPRPMIPEATVLGRLAAKADKSAQRQDGIDIAAETVRRLKELPGLRGFELRADGDHEAALAVMQKAGLGVA